MSTLNDIFKKIEDKTELSSHEVHLGSLQDVYNKIDSIGNDSKKAFDLVFKAKGTLSDAKNIQDVIIKNYQSAFVDLTKLSATVKDLGLPTNEIDAKLKMVKSYISNNETNLKNINQAIQVL
jgi:hypothetical protein